VLPRDAGAFAAELRRLSSDPGLRQELRRKARAAAEELSWSRVVATYVSAYASLNTNRGF
jgi:glycosyltransferase involved in cell wall biosynthesis